MKYVRNLLAFMMIVFLLLLVPASMAQETPMTFGLSPEDFAALMAANTATGAATSAQFSFTLTMSAANVPEPANMTLTGTGLFVKSDENPLFQLTLSGSVVSGDRTTPLDVEVRVTDNQIYFNGPAYTQGQWWYLTAEEAGGFMGMFSASSGVAVDPSSIMSNLQNREGLEDAMDTLMTLNPEDYVFLTRSGNQFTATADIGGLVGSEQLMSFMMAAASLDSELGQNVDEQAMENTTAIVREMFKNFTLTFDEYLSADSLIERAVLDVAWQLNMQIFTSEITDAVADIALNLDVSLSGYNQPYTVEVPEGSVAFSEVMQQMQQSAS